MIILRNYLNVISVIICGLDLMVFILFFSGIDLVSDEAIFPLMIGGSILGFALAWYGNKGAARHIGIWGNSLVFLITVIGPVIIRMFIWNTP